MSRNGERKRRKRGRRRRRRKMKMMLEVMSLCWVISVRRYKRLKL